MMVIRPAPSLKRNTCWAHGNSRHRLHQRRRKENAVKAWEGITDKSTFCSFFASWVFFTRFFHWHVLTLHITNLHLLAQYSLLKTLLLEPGFLDPLKHTCRRCIYCYCVTIHYLFHLSILSSPNWALNKLRWFLFPFANPTEIDLSFFHPVRIQ